MDHSLDHTLYHTLEHARDHALDLTLDHDPILIIMYINLRDNYKARRADSC